MILNNKYPIFSNPLLLIGNLFSLSATIQYYCSEEI
jgi:hypothetical protein